jgi:hypothetical protein
MPLFFAPTAITFSPSYHSGAHLNPYHTYALGTRDRYLAALAEARAAEDEYVNYLHRQQAEQALARRRREEFARRQLLQDSLYGDFDIGYQRQCYPASLSRPNYAPTAPNCSCSHAQPQPAFGRQLGYMRHPLQRQEEMGLKRKQQVRQDAETFARLLGILLSGLNSNAQPHVQTVSFAQTQLLRHVANLKLLKYQPKTVPHSALASQGVPENEVKPLEQAFKGFLVGLQRPATKQSEQVSFQSTFWSSVT